MESLGRRTSRTLLLLYLGTFNTTEQLRVKKFNLFTIFVCRIVSKLSQLQQRKIKKLFPVNYDLSLLEVSLLDMINSCCKK